MESATLTEGGGLITFNATTSSGLLLTYALYT